MAGISPLLGDFEVKESSVHLIGAGRSLVGPDPNRWGLLISNPGGGDCFISTNSIINTGTGVKLAVGALPLFLYFSVHGLLPTLPWYAINVDPPHVDITIIEVLYKPKR